MASTTRSQDEELFPVSRCTPEDIPQMQQVWNEAFAPNPLHYLGFPRTIDPAERAKWFFNRLSGQMANPIIRIFKITDASNGKIAGFTRWQFPHIPKPAPADEDVKAKEQDKKNPYPLGANIPLLDAQFGMLDAWRDRFVDVETTYVAMLLCTSPQYQRRGLGRRLMKHVLDIADEQGRKAYIEASEDGYPLYRSLGFYDLDVVETDLSEFGAPIARSVAMMRDPVVSA